MAYGNPPIKPGPPPIPPPVPPPNQRGSLGPTSMLPPKSWSPLKLSGAYLEGYKNC